MADASEELLDPAEIEALSFRDFDRPTAELDSPPGESGRRNQLDCESAGLNSAGRWRMISPEFELSSRLAEARPYELKAFDEAPEADVESEPARERVEDVELRIELGRADLSAEEASRLREGAVVPLDTLAGDPVDIVVDGRLIARGEVLVFDEKLCVRISEVLGAVQVVESPTEAVGS